jgi:GGDEF domain-containing protein
VVATPVKRRRGTPDPLAALSDLLKKSRTEPAKLFERGLALLVQALGVDRAMLTRVTALGYEVFWWAVSPKGNMTGIFEAPEKGFCPFVLAHPDRPLVIRDAAVEPRWRKSSGHLELGIRSYAGVALQLEDRSYGTLCVQHHGPRPFTRGQISLLMVLGQLMGRTMESENLKQELHSAMEALELSSAIVEDSTLQSSRSGLPNRRFLEIWLQSTLFMSRRRREPMALALWSQPLKAGTKGRLTSASGYLRGEDLLVELSADQYLLLMPHTSESGAEVLVERLRKHLGDHPTGITLWFPDGKDMTMNGALRRVASAFTEANREAKLLVWNHG